MGREYLCILFGNIRHRCIEDGVEVTFALLIPQMGNEVMRFEHRHIGRERRLKHHALVVGKLGVGSFPFVGLLDTFRQLALGILQFKAKFVVKELIEKYLCDYLVFVAVITHAVCLASGFERINQLECFVFDFRHICMNYAP